MRPPTWRPTAVGPVVCQARSRSGSYSMTVLTIEYGTPIRIDMPKRLPSSRRCGGCFASRTVPEPSMSRWRLGSAIRAKMASGGAGMNRSTVSTSLTGGMVRGATGRGDGPITLAADARVQRRRREHTLGVPRLRGGRRGRAAHARLRPGETPLVPRRRLDVHLRPQRALGQRPLPAEQLALVDDPDPVVPAVVRHGRPPGLLAVPVGRGDHAPRGLLHRPRADAPQRRAPVDRHG